jgi:cell wall-associated NlpC family hydrolase
MRGRWRGLKVDDGTTWAERRASLQFANNGVSVAKADLQPGDLVFFSSDGSGVTHVGLYYGDGMFVNASTESTGVIFSSLSSDWYTRTYWGAKRIIGS